MFWNEPLNYLTNTSHTHTLTTSNKQTNNHNARTRTISINELIKNHSGIAHHFQIELDCAFVCHLSKFTNRLARYENMLCAFKYIYVGRHLKRFISHSTLETKRFGQRIHTSNTQCKLSDRWPWMVLWVRSRKERNSMNHFVKKINEDKRIQKKSLELFQLTSCIYNFMSIALFWWIFFILWFLNKINLRWKWSFSSGFFGKPPNVTQEMP